MESFTFGIVIYFLHIQNHFVWMFQFNYLISIFPLHMVLVKWVHKMRKAL